jgi:hypothetical protein
MSGYFNTTTVAGHTGWRTLSHSRQRSQGKGVGTQELARQPRQTSTRRHLVGWVAQHSYDRDGVDLQVAPNPGFLSSCFVPTNLQSDILLAFITFGKTYQDPWAIGGNRGGNPTNSLTRNPTPSSEFSEF